MARKYTQEEREVLDKLWRKLRREESWCGVCGKTMRNSAGHKCPPRVLGAIDAAHTRSAALDLECGDYLGHPGNHRSFARRLREGVDLMLLSQDDEPWDGEPWDGEP